MMDPIQKKLTQHSYQARLERFGKLLSLGCITLIVILVGAIFYFIATKGLATFQQVKLSDFWLKTVWEPSIKDSRGVPQVGVLPMFLGSLAVTILAALLATPFAIGTAIYMTEISPKRGMKVLKPVTELLVGIPSVVYGFIGLTVVVPAIRTVFGGSGFGILAGTFVLFVMILPTVTALSVDALQAVPKDYRAASLALGATRWQTIQRLILKLALPGLLTAVVFGMARAFGEALAVQMVIGNATLIPKSLLAPASTLTSVLTMGMGNTVMGSLENNALWTLALVLLLMSLAFNLLVHYIGRKGALKTK